jgi:hypothetical protein
MHEISRRHAVTAAAAATALGALEWCCPRPAAAQTSLPLDTVIGISGPQTALSEHPVVLRTRLLTPTPVTGLSAQLQEFTAGHGWAVSAAVDLDTAGRAQVPVSVWKTSTFRMVFPGSGDLEPATSRNLTITAHPAAAPRLRPAGAPEPAPRYRRPQAPQGTGLGADPTIDLIPDGIWASMQGLTWSPGAPVGRTALRLIHVNYWGFDGYRYRGQLVLNSAVAGLAADIFTDLFHLRYPIRQMVLTDRFGHMPIAPHLGSNDYAAMAADDTSGFNFRYVDGDEPRRILSPHAFGNAIDINTWENPYAAPTGEFPDTWYEHHRPRSDRSVLQPGSPQVRAFTSRGFVWGASYGDPQHFQSSQMPDGSTGSGRHGG